MENAVKQNQSRLRANEEKWGATLLEAGWTLIPSTILERQQALGIDPVDLNILLQLARHWWVAGNPPHPSIKTIAECIGKSQSTVQRRVLKMQHDGLIEIEHRHNNSGARISSMYRFNGLIAAASELAPEVLEDRKQRQDAAAARRRRKAPLRKNVPTTLKVVQE